jgi:hypothetical protein
LRRNILEHSRRLENNDPCEEKAQNKREKAQNKREMGEMQHYTNQKHILVAGR